MNKWVLEYNKSILSLEAKNNKTEAILLRAHHEKAKVFGKDNNTGKNRGSRKRGRLNMRWIDSLKEATGRSTQELSRACSFMGSPGVRTNSIACKKHTLADNPIIHLL